jgi:single-stranded DNA-binding protein
MQMLGSRSGAGEPRGESRGDAPPMESKGADSKAAAAKKPAGKFDDLEDDIPF